MEQNRLKYIYFIPLLFTFISIFFFRTLPDDAVQYSSLGYNLFHHGFYDSSYGVVPGWLQSPGWPIIIGIFSYILPLHFIAPIISALVAVLFVFYFKSFITENFNSSLAILAVVILLINPQFLLSIKEGSSETFYALLHFFLFVQLYMLAIKKEAFSYLKIFLIALALVFLALTRSEGILYVILISISMFIFGLRKIWNNSVNLKRFEWNWLLKTAMLLAFIILLFYPYGKFTESKTGSFNISPKITFNSRVGKVPQVLQNDEDLMITNSELYEEIAWFGLDTSSYQIYANTILDTSHYFDIKKSSVNNSDVFFKNIINNFRGLLRVIVRSYAFPEIYFVLILIGVFYLIRFEFKKSIYLFLWLAPSFYFIVSHVQARFFHVFLPYLAMVAAYGVIQLLKDIKVSEKYVHFILVFLILNSSIYYIKMYQSFKEDESYRIVAEGIKQNIPEPAYITAKSFTPTFLSDKKFKKMPFCRTNDLYKYLTKNNVNYLLLGNEVNTIRKQFKPIYQEKYTNAYQLIDVFDTPGQKFKLFKVLTTN